MIVADNGSTDGSGEVVADYRRRMPGLRSVDASDRRGPGHARNAGAAAASDSSLDSGALLNELAGKLPDREVAKIVSKVTGERKNDLYRRLLEIAALRSQ